MPSSKQRHRIEIHQDVYEQLSAMAAREGYPVARFADRLLTLAMGEYIGARREGRRPMEQLAGHFARVAKHLPGIDLG